MKNSNSCSRILGGAALALTLAAGHALAAPTANGRMVFSNNTTAPQSEAYTAATNTFGAPAATATGTNGQTFFVDRAAPTRNEHVAGYVTTSGQLYVLRWNGTAWSNEWNVAVGGNGIDGRRFDIAYENTSGRAVVVYSNNTSSTLAYRIWNGTSWTAAATQASARLTGVPNAIKLAAQTTSGSNTLAATIADANSILTTLVWSGSAWGNEPSSSHGTLAGTAGQNDLWDHAYASQSGDLIVVFTTSLPQQSYRTFSAGTWSAVASINSGTQRSPPLQMFAVANPDPAVNQVLVGWNRSASPNVYARIWSGGTTLDTLTTVATNGVTTNIEQKTIAGGWVKSGTTTAAVFFWSSTTTGRLDYAYNVGGTWTLAQAWTPGGTAPGSELWMDAQTDPQSSDTLMLSFSDNASDLWSKRLVLSAGPTFTFSDADGGTPETTSLPSNTTQNFDFAYDRNAAPSGTITLADGSNPGAVTVTNGTTGALDAFSLTASPGTATINSVTVNVTAGNTALSGLSINSALACNGTTYGSIASVVAGANAITLTTTVNVGATATPLYVCATGASVVTNTTAAGTVSTVGTSTAGYTVTGTDTAGATSFTVQPPSITIGNGSAEPPAASITSGTTAALDTFSLQTNGGTATVTAVSVGLTAGNGAISSLFVNSAQACNGTTYGSSAGPFVVGNNAVNLTTSIGATGTSGTTNLFICATGATVAANTTVTGTVASVTASGFTSITDNDTTGATLTVTPPPVVNTVSPGAPSVQSATQTQVVIAAPYSGDSNGNSTTAFARATGTCPQASYAAITGCTAVTGASPRTCTDGTVAASTTYCYQVSFTDSDGITAGYTNPQTVQATTPGTGAALAVTAGTMPAAATAAAGSSGTIVGRIVLTATGGTATLASISISSTGTALATSDVSTLSLFNDATGAFVGAGVWSATTSHWVFGGLALDVAAGSPITLRAVLGLNIGATVGRTFVLNANVPTDVTVVSPATVSNTATIAGNAFTVGAGLVAGSTNTAAPMVSIVNPGDGKVVSPTSGNQFRVQIRVFSPSAQGGIPSLTANSVSLSTDNGTTWPTCPGSPFCGTQIANYNSGTPTVTGTIFEVTVTGLAAGSYTLRARASNAAVANVLSEPVSIVVGASGRGDGNLLVRDNSSQLCTDCHALQTHSSEAVGTKYGSWSATCRDCHAPHGTRNILLVQENITPPSVNGVQTARNVGFVKTTGDSGAAGWDATNKRPTPTASFVNSDNSGPCQVCHTRTQGAGAVARWRNTGNSDTHYNGASTQPCMGCHAHTGGFGAGESTGGTKCSSCHGTIWDTVNGTTAGIVSKHTLGNVSGTNDSPTDTTASWSTGNLSTAVAPASRSCVNMCHDDHVHNQPPAGTTHEYNVYLDAGTQTSRAMTRGAGGIVTAGNPTKTDFDTASGQGMCLSCHKNPVDATKPAIVGTAYNASAHDAIVTTGAAGATFSWQFRLHDNSLFDRNCTKCHASRAEGTTPSSGGAITAVHGTQDPSILSGAVNPGSTVNTTAPTAFVCYNCHGSGAATDGATNANRSNRDVWAQTQQTFYHPVNLDTVHDTAAETSAGFNSGRFTGANRHANCIDCHNPHTAAGTRANRSATATATRNQIPANSAMTGALGVTFTYANTAVPAACTANVAIPNACWPAMTATNFGASLTAATYEYQVCFKCHTSFAFGSTTYPTAPATGASGLQQTDLATEFNPGLVRSGHPVVANLSSYANSPAPKNLNATQLLAPWNTNVGTQTMLCTDCHNEEAVSPAVQGPHGSAVRFLLAGTNKAWPYTVAGATSGTVFTVSTSETNLNNANGNGLFCRNCHPQQSSTASNSLHTTLSGHASSTVVGACVGCHLRIPHGGKVSRLIVTTNAPARYKVGTPNAARFTKNTAYRSYSVQTNVGTSCADHSSGASGGEAW